MASSVFALPLGLAFLAVVPTAGWVGCVAGAASTRNAAPDERGGRAPASSRGGSQELPVESACRKVHAQMVSRISSLQRDIGLPEFASPSAPQSGVRYDTYYRAELGVLGTGSNSSIEIGFFGATCRPVTLLNNLALDSAYGPGSALYDRPTMPKWTQERAVAVGTSALRSLVAEEYLKSLKLWQTRYHHPFMDATHEHLRYRTGQWSIAWIRTDIEGHEFMNDRASVSLLEEYGLLSFRLSWNSTYDDKPRKPMGKNRAVHMATEYATKIMQWPPALARFTGFALKEHTDAKLAVVNPNHMLDLKRIEELGNPGDRNARLAWVITFGGKYAGPREQGGLVPVDAEIYVWLDAETCQFLGGDFR